MKKIALLLALFMVLALFAGCTQQAPEQSQTPDTNISGTPNDTPPASDETPPAIGQADTYWVAETYYTEDGKGTDGFQTLDPAEWFLDLTIRADGTARFRDVHEAIYLVEDSYQKLTWEKGEDEHFRFYSQLRTAPILDGIYKDSVLTLDYMGMTVNMKQATGPAADTIPAELAGTWLMVSGETEGYQYDAMPGELSGLVIKGTSIDGPLVLMADMNAWDHFGCLDYSQYGLQLEVMQMPLYEGCGNESWSVRIGPAAPIDAQGYPTQTEFYATLLSYNTLLLQRYYTLDGYPAVSYQTYARFPDLISWQDPAYMELGFSNWICTDYTDISGKSLPMPPEYKDFSICLLEDYTCLIQYADGRTGQGVWQLEHGGIVLLQSFEDADLSFWFGGAVGSYCIESDGVSTDAYQMALYYNSGILKLTFTGYG